MKRLRLILCGQKSFGAAAYAMIRETGHDLLAVYAPPGDRLFTAAQLGGSRVFPSGTLKAATVPPNTDLLVAAHSHDFISGPVRLRLRLGAIGYHPSLLPRHRGKDAVEWTVRMGDPVAGGSVYWLTDTVDGGPIARQGWCFVRPGDTASELWRRDLFPMGVRLLRETLAEISAGVLTMVDQDDALATWEPSFTGAPRLRRPELKMIGPGPEGFSVAK